MCVAFAKKQTKTKAEVVLKTIWDDGTTAIKMTPLEMMERLAALVPRLRVHLTRFHGLLGPHYKYRKLIVPKKKTELALVAGADAFANSDSNTAHPADSDKPPASTKHITWAQLLKRVFNLDVTVCSKCKGKVKIIAGNDSAKTCSESRATRI